MKLLVLIFSILGLNETRYVSIENKKVINEKCSLESNLNNYLVNKDLYKTYQYINWIKIASLLHEEDPKLMLSIALTESSLNPKAISYLGASGLFQLMPRTKEYLYKKNLFLSPSKSSDEEIFKNIYSGINYFNELHSLLGNKSLKGWSYQETKIMAYNMGPTWVRKIRRNNRYIKNHNYVSKVNSHFKKLR
ncbi:MAG: lytic transglycosylase domain-containing protein [Oligoflexia bacterium]|nr:lytic transglycosylase domain-containing protein [Oligoflexia bacterium]